MRRKFDAQSETPPNIARSEAARLKTLAVDPTATIIRLSSERGFGATRLLEDLRTWVHSNEDASDRGDLPWIFAVLDLADVGQADIGPLLVSARNDILRRVEADARNPSAEYEFVLFDVLAAVVWKRRQATTSIPLHFYRTKNRRFLAGAGKMAKSLALGEIIEATGEMTGLGTLAEKIFDRALEELTVAMSEKLSDTAKGRMGEKLLARLRQRRPHIEDLEDCLPFVFADAIRNISRRFSRRIGTTVFPSVILAVDAADMASQLTDNEESLRARLREAMLPLAHEGVAKVIVSGWNDEGQLDCWLVEETFHEINVEPFRRKMVVEAVRALAVGEAKIILDATGEDGEELWVHPSAYARAHGQVRSFDPSHPVSRIRETIQSLWPAHFSFEEFTHSLEQRWPRIDGHSLNLVWNHPFWTNSRSNGRRRTPWYLRPLNASLSERMNS